jgi:hypothetical protein
MALVAASIAVVIAMAALSIDVGTLYEASTEAQRSADAAALAAARVLSLSGMTGDPANTSGEWASACAAAIQAAQSVAGQNFVAGAAPNVVNVSFIPTDGCTSGAAAFGVNPQVTVKVANTSLPIFFARIFGLFNHAWNTASVSATATAEVYNPSNSTTLSGASMVTVQPRCVKPLIIPNLDPLNPPPTKGTYCSSSTAPACDAFVNLTSGTIVNGGIQPGSSTGVIGESFTLISDCLTGNPTCNGSGFNSPSANQTAPAPETPNLQYVPGQVLGTPVGVPSCVTSQAHNYQPAIAGCDQSTVYQCGIQATPLSSNPNEVDLNENPNGGDTATAAECLINASGPGSGNGQDSLSTGSFPYQITAGSANPLGITSGITSSNSIISVAIYDNTSPLTVKGGGNEAPVSIIGFLQVFINYVNTDGSLNVTVLNVAGCGNAATTSTPFVTGTSPVPVRLISPTS